MLDIIFLSYWIIALTSGVLALVPTVRNSRDTGMPFIRHLLGSQLIFWFVLATTFITDLNWDRNFPYHELTRISSMLGICLLVVTIPMMISAWKELSLFKSLEKIFPLAGALLFLHYLVTGGIYFATDYANGLKYFDGHRVLPAFVSFILLALVHSYFVICILSLKKNASVPARARKALRVLAFGSIAAIPLMLVFDSLRWLFPVLWNPMPEERVLILPAFYVFFNFCIVRVQKYLVAGDNGDALADSHVNLQGFGLSRREAQVAELLAEGLAYKEIASKLFISLSTVQTHVKQVYRKTDINSKMQLRDLIKEENGSETD